MSSLRRRRVLQITAAAAACVGLSGSRAERPALRWAGSALGAEASLTLDHPDPVRARRLLALALAEIDRLDRIFSLQRGDSSVSRLNRDGRLARPPGELVAVLELAARVSALSGGAFDVTVQPLWRVLAGSVGDRQPSGDDVVRAAALIDWRAVEATRAAVALARPGMAITLNGIAQGYITDRVADLLREGGLDHALVNLGETRALGRHPAPRDWRVATALGALELCDEAVAVSGPPAPSLDPIRSNLIDPRSAAPVVAPVTVVVKAPRAVLADALSTALAVAEGERRQALLAVLPTLGARAWLG